MKISKLVLVGFVFSVFSSAFGFAEDAKLKWLGHAAFQYTSKTGKTFLIDPWTKNPKAPKDIKFNKVDAVLITHGHFDHVGEAFELAKKHSAVLVASYELTEIAKRKGVKNVQPLNASGSATIHEVEVTAVRAVHSSSYQEGSQNRYAGAPLGYILSEKDSPTMYHAGDTGVFAGMEMIEEIYEPDVALLPIGGVFTMKPKEAAFAAKLLEAKAIVPMHFGTFPILTGSPKELKEAMDKASAKGKMKELTPGSEVKLKELLL